MIIAGLQKTTLIDYPGAFEDKAAWKKFLAEMLKVQPRTPEVVEAIQVAKRRLAQAA